MVDAKPDAVSRAASTLVVLGSEEALESGGLGVMRIAELTGGDKAQISRLLKILDDYGLVERDDATLAYRLGWQLFALAAGAGDRRLLEVARLLLPQLVEEIGERANLSVLRGSEVVTVFSTPSLRAVQTAGWVGRTVPAYCTSSGRALLLDHQKNDLVALFSGVDFRAFGPRSPHSVDSLYRRIVAARLHGYAVVDDEFEKGLTAAAAPVRDVHGHICAAVNVSAPKFRLGGARRMVAVGRAVKDTADEISRRVRTAPSTQLHLDAGRRRA